MRLEDFEIIATVIPNATAISKQPNIILEFMVFPHFKVGTGPLAQVNTSPPWPRCHRAKTVCPGESRVACTALLVDPAKSTDWPHVGRTGSLGEVEEWSDALGAVLPNDLSEEVFRRAHEFFRIPIELPDARVHIRSGCHRCGLL